MNQFRITHVTARLAAVVMVVVLPVHAEQELASRLQYTTPESWTPSLDGRSLFPPSGNAAVTFIRSMPFTGTNVQWLEEAWNGIRQDINLVMSPVTGVQGDFLTRIGVFEQADGTRIWLCLNTVVQNGYGEGVIFIADSETRFAAHLPALGQLIQSISFAAPNVASVRGPAIPGGNDVAGLYLATTRQLRFNPLGGSDWEVRTEFYLLSPDGRVFRGPDLPDAPDGNIRRFDYDAACRKAPAACGTYAVNGSDLGLSMGERSEETVVATRVEPDALQIRGTRYTRSVRDSGLSIDVQVSTDQAGLVKP